MSSVRAFLDRLDDPKLPPLGVPDPADAPLLALLVHFAASDGTVESDEFALLQRIRSDLDPGELLSWAADVSAQPLDLDAVVGSTGSVDERWDVLRFAARVVGIDGDVQQIEASRLGELSRKLGLPPNAPRQALEEVVANGGPVEESRVGTALAGMAWSRLSWSADPPSSDLAGIGSPRTLGTVRLGEVEVAVVHPDGIAVRFDQGPAFVRWVDLRTYTRVPVAGAAFHVQSWDGRRFTTTDDRLRELAGLLDRVYTRGPRG